MDIMAHPKAFKLLKQAIEPIAEVGDEANDICHLVGDASIVLIGEATHGTEEFYASRAAITQALIEQKGFNVVAIEADWPDAYQLNRFVRGKLKEADLSAAFSHFKRFPEWMWRNAVTENFLGWLAHYNQPRNYPDKIGIYGLDMYSLFNSIDAVIKYLEVLDSGAARRAEARYSCFDSYADPQLYGYHAHQDWDVGCLKAVLAQLEELRYGSQVYTLNTPEAEDEYFFAEQNAAVIKTAEHYYRAMFKSNAISWNVRDKHMADTVDQLLQHFRAYHQPVKMVVWAHNSHVGDARATQMHEHGELNLGQILRQRYAEKVFNIGYSTYTGTVLAADSWGHAARVMKLKNALPGSYEETFHMLNTPRFWLDIKNQYKALSFLRDSLQRAVGVVYRPDTERYSHYFYANLVEQFDAVIHFNHTHALQASHAVSELAKEYAEAME